MHFSTAKLIQNCGFSTRPRFSPIFWYFPALFHCKIHAFFSLKQFFSSTAFRYVHRYRHITSYHIQYLTMKQPFSFFILSSFYFFSPLRSLRERSSCVLRIRRMVFARLVGCLPVSMACAPCAATPTHWPQTDAIIHCGNR